MVTWVLKTTNHQGNFDPQTLADRQAQRCIVENLRAIYGSQLRIVGEEGELGLESTTHRNPQNQFMTFVASFFDVFKYNILHIYIYIYIYIIYICTYIYN